MGVKQAIETRGTINNVFLINQFITHLYRAGNIRIWRDDIVDIVEWDVGQGGGSVCHIVYIFSRIFIVINKLLMMVTAVGPCWSHATLNGGGDIVYFAKT